MRLSIFLFITVILVGCTPPQKQKIQIFPMETWEEKSRLKQLFTYNFDPVYKEIVEIDRKEVVVTKKTVYINNKSQLTYKDGTPITGPSGYFVFWESKGRFVNTQYIQVHEDQLFAVDGVPMKRGTPILIKEYFDHAKADYERNHAKG